MNWKSTAVVSGVGLVATWLAATPPAVSTAVSRVPPGETARAAATVSDIQQQAAHLSIKLHPDEAFHAPSRNPFRFAQTERTHPAETTTFETPAVAAPAPAPAPPPPSLITLSGIASDRVGEKEERTAILTTPNGLVLAHEGEEVAGQFRVGTIGEEAVELIRVADGSVLRITLKP